MLTQKTAAAIHNCHQQIANAETLLKDMHEAYVQNDSMDLIDAFGRKRGLQLGVPSGRDSHRIFNVDNDLAVVIIEAQIAKYKTQLAALNELAKQECTTDQ